MWVGSHSVTCHLTQVNASHPNPYQNGWYSINLTQRGELTLAADLHTEIVYPPTDGHPAKCKPGPT